MTNKIVLFFGIDSILNSQTSLEKCDEFIRKLLKNNTDIIFCSAKPIDEVNNLRNSFSITSPFILGYVNTTLYYANNYSVDKISDCNDIILNERTFDNTFKAAKTLITIYKKNYNNLVTLGIDSSINDHHFLRAVDMPFLVQQHDRTWYETTIAVNRIKGIGPNGFINTVKSLFKTSLFNL